MWFCKKNEDLKNENINKYHNSNCPICESHKVNLKSEGCSYFNYKISIKCESCKFTVEKDGRNDKFLDPSELMLVLNKIINFWERRRPIFPTQK